MTNPATEVKLDCGHPATMRDRDGKQWSRQGRKVKMKADSTIRKELRDLRRLIDSPDADNLTKRVAWEIEQAIRWAREDVKGWSSPLASAVGGANLIREEVKRGDIKI